MPDTSTLGVGLSWRTVGILSSIVSIGSITTLIIVATVSSADALSTIGMVLAIIAFVSQLIQNASQILMGNSQYQETVRVYNETHTLLAEIRVSTGNLIERRDRQFERLLETVVPAAVAEGLAEQPADSNAVDVDELARRVVETTLAQLPAHSELEHSPRPTRLDDLAEAHPVIAHALRSEPASVQLKVWRQLSNLPPAELVRMTQDQLLTVIRDAERSA